MKKLKTLCSILCFAAFVNTGYSQTIYPSVGVEENIPTTPLAGQLSGFTSNYTCTGQSWVEQNGNAHNMDAAVYLAGLGSSTSSTFTWHVCNAVITPTLATWREQGQFSYPGCTHLEVGMLKDDPTGELTFVVAYYDGSGHKVDFYQQNSSGVVVLVPALTINISTTNLSRISIDNHKDDQIVLAWAESDGIHTKAIYSAPGGGIGTGPSKLLERTEDCILPDVATNHDINGIAAHYCYYNPTTQEIIEADILYSDLLLTGSTATPNEFDRNSVSGAWSPGVIYPNIDCPDHSLGADWTYTYSDAIKVFMRVFKDLPGNVPVTSVLNDASLPAQSTGTTYSAKNLYPTPAYDPFDEKVHVGWFFGNLPANPSVPYPYSQTYIGVQVRDDGSDLVSPATGDFLFIPYNYTTSGGAEALSFSKQNDASDFMYIIFDDTIIPLLWVHKYHPRPNSFFKSASNPNNTCRNSNHTVANSSKILPQTEIFVSPNPFNGAFKITANGVAAETLNIELSNAVGQVILKQSGYLEDINNIIAKETPHIANGILFLKVSSNDRRISQVFRIEKQ